MGEGLKRNLVVGLAVVAAGWLAYTWLGGRDGTNTRLANYRVLQDINTGKNYRVNITTKDYGPYPHKNRSTGEMTLYPTEVCYWNECGEKGGTRVILNRWCPDQKNEPTVCPVCGHGVKSHNPRPPGYKDDK